MKNVKIINFNIIHHECRGTSLKNSYEYYQTVQENKFQKCTPEVKETILDAGLSTKTKLNNQSIFKNSL